MRKYIPGIILTLLIGFFGIFNADTKALDSDYKNNLLKVDVVKASDGSYKIDLFTQKPYNEPIKVIKKSDTSYYVFLPETYHSITSVGTSGDINKVDVKLYPYAGQDLNNGYTKIDISTSKPVTFTTNVKTAVKQAPKVDAKKLAQLDSAFDGKPNYPTKVETKPTPAPAVKTQVPVVKPAEVKEPVKEPAKEVQKEPVKVAAKPETPAKTIAEKVDKAIDKAKQDAEKIASNTGAEIEIITKTKSAAEGKKDFSDNVGKKASPADLEDLMDGELSDEDIRDLEEAKGEDLTELATGEQETIPEMTGKQQLKHNIRMFAKKVLNNILLIISIVLFLIVIIMLIAPKRKSEKESTAPAAPKYETLGSIVDEVIAKTNTSAQEAPAEKSESVTLETTQASVSTSATDETAADDTVYEPKLTPAYVESATATVEKEEPAEDEADVLASESFGENRGLCLVNYGGSIALIGYIGEEIFVIQNFGKVTLLNPSIQIRIAEQNDRDTIYIVKTANSKLMVRETKTFIGLEMVM